jgi:CheY-like chemotaxis protein
VVEYLRVFRHVGFFRFLAGPVDHWRVSRMPTALHAEADRVLRNASLSFLSSQGWEVDVADDALECLAKLRRRVPDLLVLDLELPAHVLGKLASFQQQPPFVLALTKPFPLSALLDDRAFDAVNVRKRFANDRRRRAVLVTD